MGKKVYKGKFILFCGFCPSEIIFSQTCEICTQLKSWKISLHETSESSFHLFFKTLNTFTYILSVSASLLSAALPKNYSCFRFLHNLIFWVLNSGRLLASLHFFLYCSLQRPAINAWYFRTLSVLSEIMTLHCLLSSVWKFLPFFVCDTVSQLFR